MVSKDNLCQLFGKLLSYPQSDYQQLVQRCVEAIQDLHGATMDLSLFAKQIRGLSVERLEELYTQTFDLSPVCSLEIGWHLYGENYSRGEFMVKVRQLLREYGVAECTELPDHLTHVLPLIECFDRLEAVKWIQEYITPAIEIILASLDGKENIFENLVRALKKFLTESYATALENDCGGR